MRKIRRFRGYNQTTLTPWEQKVYNDLADAAEIERLEPVGAPSWGRHLAMALSVAGCLSAAVFVGVLAVMLRRRFELGPAMGDAGFYAGLTLAVTLAGGTLLAVVDFRGGLASVERILGRDLDGDGAIGHPTRLEVTIEGEQGRRVKFLDLDLPDHFLYTFARAAVNNLPLSEREWTGDGKLTLAQYRKLRNELIKHGLAQWKRPGNRRAGWELTGSGLATMRELADG